MGGDFSMLASAFLKEAEGLEKIEVLPHTGSTSLSCLVRIKGKEYFMKQLRPEFKDNWRYRAAFHKEFEVGKRIKHEHIVKYISLNENEEGIYLLMEHINGMTLEEKLAQEPSYFSKAIHIEKLFIQLLKALKALHDNHVAYLDLKPENIILTQVNNDVKLIDLGFCLDDTYSYTVGHNKQFAAPEVLLGEPSKLTARSDIYSLGKLMEYLNKLCVRKTPILMQQILEKCTRENPEERYGSVDEILKDIKRKKRNIIGSIAAITLGIALTLCALFIVQYRQALWNNPRHIEALRLHTYWKLRPILCHHDKVYQDVRYRILSKDSATCMVVGARNAKNIYIFETVNIRNKEYTTTHIDHHAFGGKEIQSVHIPSSITHIGNDAFNECTQLVTVTLPESIVEIGNNCFRRNKTMTTLKLPEQMKEIAPRSFSMCPSLSKVIIPEGVESIGLDAFGICKNLQEVILPSTLTTLSRGAFWECESLESISIPAKVENIGEYAFYGCIGLKDVYNYASEPQNVTRIFNTKDLRIHVPAASLAAYQQAEHWKNFQLIGDL